MMASSGEDVPPCPPGTLTHTTLVRSSAHSWPPPCLFRPSPLLLRFLECSSNLLVDDPCHVSCLEEGDDCSLKKRKRIHVGEDDGGGGGGRSDFNVNFRKGGGGGLSVDAAVVSFPSSSQPTHTFRSFEEARTYVRILKLKSKKEWEAWSKSGSRPPDIPSQPAKTYKLSGWTSYPDFLGYADSKVTGSFRSFEEARTYVRTLGMKSKKEWDVWSKSGARPHDIPSDPYATYALSGWLSIGDFLGYAEGQGARRSFRSFEDARSYVRTLGLKSQEEWIAWSKSGARPHDIPAAPDQKYKSSGWLSCADFLGYGVDKVTDCSFRTFEEARTYVRTLGLKSYKEWWAWSASGARPNDIPSRPDKTYASTGWLSIGDFLGYKEGKVTSSYRSFEEARAYVRALDLKSTEKWNAWSKSGARPHDIPSSPYDAYALTGWLSMGDFLGYAEGQGAKSTRNSKFRTFEQARTYVRTLGLKSAREWQAWSKSGSRPSDIPSHPDVTYTSSGWLSYGDFLGYGKGKAAVSTENVCIELIALPRALEREPNDITLPQISQRFVVFDTPMLEMRYAAMYVAQMLREDGYKGINDGDIELRLLSGDMVSLTEHKIRDVLVLTASGTSASGSTPLLKVHYKHIRGGALDTLDHTFKEE
ncbi:hypothetical protein PPROV_001117100 [Pycnococcus provasolii]|uniref:Uncharacterized protein n=1 Tax=Pycnococcus provasolii TaxID=41880 RepID=A0A830I058_9CHLO|nr:hypothetical protein PPROV_001117100 [Pycnococcus provasolii]